MSTHRQMSQVYINKAPHGSHELSRGPQCSVQRKGINRRAGHGNICPPEQSKVSSRLLDDSPRHRMSLVTRKLTHWPPPRSERKSKQSTTKWATLRRSLCHMNCCMVTMELPNKEEYRALTGCRAGHSKTRWRSSPSVCRAQCGQCRSGRGTPVRLPKTIGRVWHPIRKRKSKRMRRAVSGSRKREHGDM